jgi:4-carboxymuconolactone decarboxylase
MPSRIPPLDPPYESDIELLLSKMMPSASSSEPLKLFRTLARNPELAGRMRPLGGGFLGRASSIDPRDREIVIDRVCARCGCEYEWGVHAAAFGAALGIAEETLHATALASPDDPVWSARERLLVRLVDQVHDTGDLSDDLWSEVSAQWSPPQILEILMLAGFYHAISFVANAARVPLESWAAHFPKA